MSKDYRNKSTIRGIRNNNPGNLIITGNTWLGKVKGTDTRFETFVSMKYGLRALLKNLVTGINKGNNTLTKLLRVYAPEFENDTAAYIASVSKITGLTANQVLTTSKSNLIAVAKAIVYVECTKVGFDLLTDSDYSEAYAAMNDKTVTTSKNVLMSVLLPVALFFYTIGTLVPVHNNDKITTLKTHKNVTKIQNVVCHK